MVRITGRSGVQIRLQRIASQETIQNVGAALFAGGEAIRAEAHQMIEDDSRSGVFVKQGVVRKNFNRSAPGEAPAHDTKTLENNIETTQPAPLHVEVSSNAPYAVALEFGTSKMAARPYMVPATERKRKEVVALIRGAIDDVLKG